jgi:hypothetical protein
MADRAQQRLRITDRELDQHGEDSNKGREADRHVCV